MNIFAVLDTSDVEDEVVQKNVPKKKGKDESNVKNDTDNKKVAAQKPAKVQQTKNEVKPVATQVAAGDDGKEVKEDNRGGRPRGKEGHRHGDKHHGVEEGKRPPKREFERRSGTGRGKEISRGGRGPYGFGNVDQEAHEAEKNASTTNEGGVENVDDSNEPENESSEVAAVEEPQISFDDFVRQRAEARANSSVLSSSKNVRSINKDNFAGLVSKVDENVEDENKAKSNSNKKEQRSTNKAQILDVQFKFENASENRNNGGRGRGREFTRGGGGREFTRGGRGRDNRNRNFRPRDSPAPLNSGDFPSL